MKYKLINKTKISRDILETLIEFAFPKDVDDVTISVMYDKTGSAWNAYTSGFSSKKRTVKIWIQKGQIKFPRYSNDRRAKSAGYDPVFLITDTDELLVSLFAHELRHIWQSSVSRQNFLKSKLGYYTSWDGEKMTCISRMEKDACKYAKKTLERYRNL